MRPVIATTAHRGVFFGYTDAREGENIHLTGAKMAIYWNTTKGFMELAHVGPNEGSKVSAPADIYLRGVVSISEVTPEAEARWKEA